MKSILGVSCIAATLFVSGCGQSVQTQQSELQGSLLVSETAVAAYSASPKANPAVVCHMKQLLATSQAALTAWETSPAGNTAEQNVLAAAEAALTNYIANPIPSGNAGC